MLSESCVLTSLNLHALGRKRRDADRTKAVNAERNTASDAYTVIKNLFPGDADKHLLPILTEQSALRQWWFTHTLPWDEDGKRLLRVKLIDAALQQVRGSKGRIDQLAGVFADHYEAAVLTALAALNGDGNPRDYHCRPVDPGTPGAIEHHGQYWALPPRDAVIARFAVRFDTAPVPDAAVCRTHLGEVLGEELAAQEAEWHEREARVVEGARLELFERLATPLAKLVTVFTQTKAEGREPAPRSVHAVVRNLREIVDLIPAIQIGDCPPLEELRLLAQQELCGYTPDELKGSATARDTAAAKAQAILDKMAGYVG